jgi:hypothetical protein
LEAGVTTSFYEAKGNVHGLIGLRKIIPSGEHDCRSMTGRLSGIINGLEELSTQ